ncbi:hypothetical protein D3C73_1286360 [compost metagenome]
MSRVFGQHIHVIVQKKGKRPVIERPVLLCRHPSIVDSCRDSKALRCRNLLQISIEHLLGSPK